METGRGILVVYSVIFKDAVSTLHRTATGLGHFSFPRVWDALGFVLRVVLGEDESYARVPSSFVFFLSRLRIWHLLASV